MSKSFKALVFISLVQFMSVTGTEIDPAALLSTAERSPATAAATKAEPPVEKAEEWAQENGFKPFQKRTDVELQGDAAKEEELSEDSGSVAAEEESEHGDEDHSEADEEAEDDGEDQEEDHEEDEDEEDDEHEDDEDDEDDREEDDEGEDEGEGDDKDEEGKSLLQEGDAAVTIDAGAEANSQTEQQSQEDESEEDREEGEEEEQDDEHEGEEDEEDNDEDGKEDEEGQEDEDDMSDLFASADTDKDGKLSLAELVKELEANKDVNTPSPETLGEAFVKADEDKDNLLSKEEIVKLSEIIDGKPEQNEAEAKL